MTSVLMMLLGYSVSWKVWPQVSSRRKWINIGRLVCWKSFFLSTELFLCVIHLFPMLLANNNIRKKLMYCSNLLLFVLSIADSNKARQRIQTKIAKDKTKLSQAMDFYNRLVSAEDAVGPVDVILAAECPLWPWDMEAYM